MSTVVRQAKPENKWFIASTSVNVLLLHGEHNFITLPMIIYKYNCFKISPKNNENMCLIKNEIYLQSRVRYARWLYAIILSKFSNQEWIKYML